MKIDQRFSYSPLDTPPDPSMMTKAGYQMWLNGKAAYEAEQRHVAEDLAIQQQAAEERAAAFRPEWTPLPSSSDIELARRAKEEERENTRYRAEAGMYRRLVIEETDPREQDAWLCEFARRAVDPRTGKTIIGRYENLNHAARERTNYFIYSADGNHLFPPDQPIKVTKPVKVESKYAKYRNDRCHWVCPHLGCQAKYLSEAEFAQHLEMTLNCSRCGRCCNSGHYHNCSGKNIESEDIRLLREGQSPEPPFEKRGQTLEEWIDAEWKRLYGDWEPF